VAGHLQATIGISIIARWCGIESSLLRRDE